MYKILSAEAFRGMYCLPQYSQLQPLFSQLFCIPSTHAPVECVFSKTERMMLNSHVRLSAENNCVSEMQYRH